MVPISCCASFKNCSSNNYGATCNKPRGPPSSCSGYLAPPPGRLQPTSSLWELGRLASIIALFPGPEEPSTCSSHLLLLIRRRLGCRKDLLGIFLKLCYWHIYNNILFFLSLSLLFLLLLLLLLLLLYYHYYFNHRYYYYYSYKAKLS